MTAVAAASRFDRAEASPSDEHRLFRESARRFFETECAPYQDSWERTGAIPRSIWTRAAELGLLGARVPQRLGGYGVDFLFSAILAEEQVLAGGRLPAFWTHSDFAAPLVANFATAEQQRRLLPAMCAGEKLATVAAGEFAAASSRPLEAHRERGGYRLSGRLGGIVNGGAADVVVAPATSGGSISLFIIEAESASGLTRGPSRRVLGDPAADIARLELQDVFVPFANLLGGVEGKGEEQLAERVSEQRLLFGVRACADIERALTLTIDYVKARSVFGKRLIEFQNTRFKLAEAKTEAAILRVLLNRSIGDLLAGRLDPARSAALVCLALERQGTIIDDCLQLHGGYGYILDFPIARMWRDARPARLAVASGAILADLINSA